MKIVQHDTWTEYQWERGDLVRLKRPEVSAYRGYGARAGDWGIVTSCRDSYYVEVSCHGYSRTMDSICGFANASKFDLQPWVRTPEDESAIERNIVDTLYRIAWLHGKIVTDHDHHSLSLHGRSISGGYHSRLCIRRLLLPELSRYILGASAEIDPLSWSWTINEAGHTLLDQHQLQTTIGLPGGGNAFRLKFDRRGIVTVRDAGTAVEHEFTGAHAARLIDTRMVEVGVLTDGKFPLAIRKALPYPRSFRYDPHIGLAIIEVAPDEFAVHHLGRSIGTVTTHAAALRRGCRKIVDLLSWIGRHRLLDTPA